MGFSQRIRCSVFLSISLFLLCSASSVYAAFTVTPNYSQAGSIIADWDHPSSYNFGNYGFATNTLTVDWNGVTVFTHNYDSLVHYAQVDDLPAGNYTVSIRLCGAYASGNSGGCVNDSAQITLGTDAYADFVPSEPINLEDYQLYYGDFNGDGVDGDIYFHGRRLFVPIHSDILIPLFVDGPEGFVFFMSVNGYTEAKQISVDTQDLQNYELVDMSTRTLFGDMNGDGLTDIFILGQNAEDPALSVMSSSTAVAPVSHAVLYEGFNVSDPSINWVLEDRNGDGRDDLIRSGDRLYADWVYNAQADGSFSANYTTDDVSIIRTANIAGASDGQFRVNEQGAATYTIPISVPSGTAGVKPSLALSYSSHGGDGLMGKGWSIGGESSISLCPKTLFRDGVTNPLTLDPSIDALCLDGQRLIPDGNGYLRTEIDTFVRVKDRGVYYTAEAKDGSIKFYGKYSVDRQTFASGKIMKWALSKACDSVGNCIDYDYAQNNGSDFRLHAVRFAYGETGGATTDRNAEVLFYYETRADIKRSYIAGELLSTTQRLSHVVVRNKKNGLWHELRRFNVYYRGHVPSDLYLQSYVKAIQECVGENNCLPATTFNWEFNEGNQFAEENESGVWDERILLENGTSHLADFFPMDINGDGYQDIAWLEYDDEHFDSMINGQVRYAYFNPSTQGFDIQNFKDGDDDMYLSGDSNGSIENRPRKQYSAVSITIWMAAKILRFTSINTIV